MIPIFPQPVTDPRPDADFGVIDDADRCAEVVAALVRTPIRDFDVRTVALVDPAGVEGRVIVRAAGQAWSLTMLEVGCLTILSRLEPGLRCPDVFADLFSAALHEAEAKVAAIHARQRAEML